MEEKDFIFDGEEESAKFEPFKVGSIVIVNGDNYTLTELIETRDISDDLGFPAVYSWYKAKTENDEEVNLFFYDDDIDSVEKNNQVAKKWWDESYRN